MEIQKVLIVGSGLMGSGIAQVCAQAGLSVLLNDVSKASLERAQANIAWSVGKFIEKGKLHEDQASVMSRITTTTSLEACAGVNLAIEAVFEQLELKQSVFKELDQRLEPGCLLASNTSSMSITTLAAETSRPESVFGLHFFSPVPMMKAVEIIKGLSTSEATAARGKAFALRIDKEPIIVNLDIPGFVINRINFPSTIEAMHLVEAGVASCDDIDKGLRLASGRRMGVFETGDMVGLDVTYGAMLSMYNETGEARFYPPLLLRRKVKAGHLGRKTGKGWYEYDENGNRKT